MGIREVQASDARIHLAQLLDAVERGESVRITRHGRPIARLVREAKRRRAEIDQAIAACWVLDDEGHPIAARALEGIRSDQAIAPSLWWFEVRNTMLMSERRGRLTEADTALFLRELARFGVRLDQAPDEPSVLALAREYRLTVYDVSTLELAGREAIPLATLDAALQKAATTLGVETLGVAGG